MDDVARLLAHEEIRQLVYRYALAIDSRDLDALVELFVDDVRVGHEASGREALRESFDHQLRAIGISILSVGNHIIELEDDDHATGIVYCRGEIQLDERWIVQMIQYRDRYARRAGRWHFVRRVHLLWYGAEVGQSPIGLAPANWPESQVGRGTLPESWESWRRFWEKEG